MNIIISPAKKMNDREDELEWADLPCFLSMAELLKEYIRGMSQDEARSLWACNEKIAALNYARFKNMDLTRRLTPALLSYEGIQYQYMAPGVFERKQWDYVQKHLKILSGFYGMLRPLDGIAPYRLEMQARVSLPPDLLMRHGMMSQGGTVCQDGTSGPKTSIGWKGISSLYEFWGSSLYRELVKEDKVVVNLASKEYSKAIEPYLTPDITYLTCVFGSKECGGDGRAKIKVKATEAKMARGEMVRYMAEYGIKQPEELKGFDRLGYCYSEEYSGAGEYVFLKYSPEDER